MTVGMLGCGGGGDSTSDIISDMCERMDSCGYLGMMGMTVSECKKSGNSQAGEPTDEKKAAARACLAKSSCEAFMECIAEL